MSTLYKPGPYNAARADISLANARRQVGDHTNAEGSRSALVKMVPVSLRRRLRRRSVTVPRCGATAYVDGCGVSGRTVQEQWAEYYEAGLFAWMPAGLRRLIAWQLQNAFPET